MRNLSVQNAAEILPIDGYRGALAGRVWRPDVGPCVVAFREDGVFDISELHPAMSELAALPNPAQALKAARGEWVASLEEIIANTPVDRRDPSKPD